MATAGDKPSSSSAEEEVWIAISAFEQILEAMPTDRSSLEALAHAYEQIGDHVRAKEYLLRLAAVVGGEGDAAAATPLIRQLAVYADDELVQTATRTLQALVNSVAPAAMGLELPGPTPLTRREVLRYESFNLADELSFAWTLLEGTHLTQDEYSALVHDLTEMASGDSKATVSVLHALEFRQFKGLERVMVAVSKECATPILTLSLFDIPQPAVESLPFEFMVRRGALVFDFIGSEALVVVMNAYDASLRESVSELTGKTCHFFMSLPSEFDKVMTRTREAIEIAQKAASA